MPESAGGEEPGGPEGFEEPQGSEGFEELEAGFEHHHVDAAVMVSFGPVQAGREALAVGQFTDISRYFGQLLSGGAISSFKPYFFADGQMGDVSGFFLLEGERASLDALRRSEDFVRRLLAAGAAVHNLRAHTLVAGSEAGRLVNLYREVRSQLGLIEE